MTETKPTYETTWRARYHAFLRSPEWRRMRNLVLRRDGYMCTACGNAPATQVHHESYRYGRFTPAWELHSVCDACHERLTAIDKGEMRPWDFNEQEAEHDQPY